MCVEVLSQSFTYNGTLETHAAVDGVRVGMDRGILGMLELYQHLSEYAIH